MKRAAAMARGTLFHRIFELWDFKKDLLPPLDELIHESGLDFREAKEFRATMEEAIAVFRLPDHERTVEKAVFCQFFHQNAAILNLISSMLSCFSALLIFSFNSSFRKPS